MKRRQLLTILASACAAVRLRASEAAAALRGKLATGSPAKLAAAAETVELTGDGPTMLVLADSRLNGVDFEVNGTPAEPGKFRVDPIHKRNMFVYKGGKRLMISYWCSVCSIRTWQPGSCLCCQDETELDLGESFETVK